MGFVGCLRDSININLMKTVVINGGTKGVGKQIVLACLENGYNVVFGGKDELAAEKILQNLDNSKCQFVKIDNSNIDSLKMMFDVAIGLFHSIDGYIHYAGITPVSGLQDCDEETYDRVFEINYRRSRC